jgi:hypothetical protein
MVATKTAKKSVKKTATGKRTRSKSDGPRIEVALGRRSKHHIDPVSEKLSKMTTVAEMLDYGRRETKGNPKYGPERWDKIAVAVEKGLQMGLARMRIGNLVRGFHAAKENKRHERLAGKGPRRNSVLVHEKTSAEEATKRDLAEKPAGKTASGKKARRKLKQLDIDDVAAKQDAEAEENAEKTVEELTAEPSADDPDIDV